MSLPAQPAAGLTDTQNTEAIFGTFYSDWWDGMLACLKWCSSSSMVHYHALQNWPNQNKNLQAHIFAQTTSECPLILNKHLTLPPLIPPELSTYISVALMTNITHYNTSILSLYEGFLLSCPSVKMVVWVLRKHILVTVDPGVTVRPLFTHTFYNYQIWNIQVLWLSQKQE